MSEAISGANLSAQPACRYAHAGYFLRTEVSVARIERSRNPRELRDRSIQAAGSGDAITVHATTFRRRKQENECMTSASVPVSKDGSRFDATTCRRAGGYWVGPKGHEQKYSSFDDALAALAGMTTPRWRRPNAVGNWGLVAGTHWEP
jgi:hypothetical protein